MYGQHKNLITIKIKYLYNIVHYMKNILKIYCNKITVEWTWRKLLLMYNNKIIIYIMTQRLLFVLFIHDTILWRGIIYIARAKLWVKNSILWKFTFCLVLLFLASQSTKLQNIFSRYHLYYIFSLLLVRLSCPGPLY